MSAGAIKTGTSNELVCLAVYPHHISEFMHVIQEQEDEIRGLRRLLAAGLSGAPRQTAQREFKAYRSIRLAGIPQGWTPSNQAI
jgi:hypothetical protein